MKQQKRQTEFNFLNTDTSSAGRVHTLKHLNVFYLNQSF